MEDDLPSNFETIVVGTGMPECILAAAHSRNGKQVLHIDRNDYYGGTWATFNFDGLEQWMQKVKEINNGDVHEPVCDFNALINDTERAIPCSYNRNVFANIQYRSFVEEHDKNKLSSDEETESCSKVSHAEPVEKVDDAIKTQDGAESAEATSKLVNESDVPASEVTEKIQWSMEKFRKLYRKFNLDLAPKLLFSRGELVDLLISSNIARYADFKSVTRVLTFLNGKLEQVPCSRADVFSTKNVTIVEKRMLMKLLTFCLNFEANPNEYKGFENRTFVDFLKSRKLTPNVQHYVLHAIAMIPESASTLEGLKATQRFLNSLGRYGNTPFLWPLFGSSELPQCFCRLCAVFGGIYCLKRELDAVIVDSENKCKGIISNGKRLNCSSLIMDAHFAPKHFLPPNFGDRQISRAILLTSKSTLLADKEQLTFLRLPAGNGLQNAVWVVELGPAAMACPMDLYVVHLTCSKIVDAETDLKVAVELLFDVDASTVNSEEVGNVKNEGKPNLLWCMYFNQLDNSVCDLRSYCPTNVYLTSGPSAGFDFDEAVIEAKELFTSMFPDEEFLPRAPDSEEIVIEDAEEATPEPGFAGDTVVPVLVSITSPEDPEEECCEISGTENVQNEADAGNLQNDPCDQEADPIASVAADENSMKKEE